MANKPKKLALAIDADFFAFQAAAGNSSVIEWEDGIVEQWGDVNKAFSDFQGRIEALKGLRKAFADAEPVMVFTDKENWRKGVLPTYKSGRSGKPVVYWSLKKRIEEEYRCLQKPSLEGDDIIGLLMTAPSLVGADDVVAISVDKDFNTVPGKFLWYDTFGGRHEYKEISFADANYWHMLQTLMGDVTDGYAGCPGLGRTGAVEFLESPYVAYQKERILKSGPRKGESEWQWSKRPMEEGETLWTGVVSLFEKAGLTEEDALVQARVARILRSQDVDFKKVFPDAIKLWDPDRDKEDPNVLL